MNEASLDTWTSIFFVVSIFGVFFSSLFFLKGSHHLKSVWPIPVLILGFSIVLFQYSLFWTGHIRTFPFLNFTLSAWFLSFGPLIYFYTSKFFNVPIKKAFLHFILPLISLVLSFVLYLQYFAYFHFEKDSLFLEGVYLLNNHWIAISSMLIYLLVAFGIQNRAKRQESHKIMHKWIITLLMAFFVFILSFLSYYILVQFSFFNQSWDYGIAVGMSISVFTIGFFVYYEPALFNGEIKWAMKESTSSEFSDENSATFYGEIVSEITSNELFLKGDLRLADISQSIGLSLHDASKIINLHSGKNFNQFINDFRVERAQNLLQTTQLSVKEICFLSGFNSKVTFYAAFKSKTEKTPAEYRKSGSFKS